MAPTTAMRSLRVSAELDVNRYVGPAQQKVAADNAMTASSNRAGAAQTELNTKVSQAGDPLVRLSRQFVSGYGDAERFNRALITLARGVDSGNISLAQAQPILDGMYRKYNLVADASAIAARGQTELAAMVAAANARLEQQEASADGAAAAQHRLAGATRAASFQQRNLAYQLLDVSQTLALGMNPLMVLMQQGPQIAQIYGPDEGGIGRAFSESGKMIGGFIARLGPLIIVTAAVATAFAALTTEINRGPGIDVSFWDVIRASLELLGEAIWTTVKPAVDWLGDVWDTVSPAINSGVNVIIGTFDLAVRQIRTNWALLPAALGDIAISTANNVVNAIVGMINTSIDKLNGLKQTARDNGFGWAVGEDFKPVDPMNLPNPFAGGEDRLNSEQQSNIDAVRGNIASNAYTGMIGTRAREIAGRPTDEDIKAMERAKEAYDKLVDSTNERIAALELEAEAMGLSRIEAMSLVNLNELMAEAERTGIEMTEPRIEQITRLAERYTDAELALQGLHMEMENQSPWDTMAAQLEYLEEQLRRGNISWQTYAAEVGKAIEEMVDKYAAAASGILGQVQGLFDALGQMERQRIENSGLAGDELTAALEEQAREQFEINKKIALANAVVAGGEAIVKSYNWGTTLGGPAGGAIAAGIAAAATAAQIAAIASSSYEAPSRTAAGGGSGSGSAAAQQQNQVSATFYVHGDSATESSVRQTADALAELINNKGGTKLVAAVHKVAKR